MNRRLELYCTQAIPADDTVNGHTGRNLEFSESSMSRKCHTCTCDFSQLECVAIGGQSLSSYSFSTRPSLIVAPFFDTASPLKHLTCIPVRFKPLKVFLRYFLSFSKAHLQDERRWWWKVTRTYAAEAETAAAR